MDVLSDTVHCVQLKCRRVTCYINAAVVYPVRFINKRSAAVLEVSRSLPIAALYDPEQAHNNLSLGVFEPT